MDFAIQFCSPAYAITIFRDVYEWTEKRQLAIQKYNENKEKMLYETQKLLYEMMNPNPDPQYPPFNSFFCEVIHY